MVLPAWESVTPLAMAGKNFLILQPKHLTPPQLAQFDLVILANVRSLNDEQVRAVADYVKRGGRLIATQETSCYDGSLPDPVESRDYAAAVGLNFPPAKNEPRTGSAKEPACTIGKRRSRPNSWPIGENSSPNRWPASVPRARRVPQSSRTWDGQHTLLYLLNYSDRPAAGCRATLNLPSPARSLRLHIPGSQAAQLSPNSAGEGLSVDIPKFDSLAVLEIWSGQVLAIPVRRIVDMRARGSSSFGVMA